MALELVAAAIAFYGGVIVFISLLSTLFGEIINFSFIVGGGGAEYNMKIQSKWDLVNPLLEWINKSNLASLRGRVLPPTWSGLQTDLEGTQSIPKLFSGCSRTQKPPFPPFHRNTRSYHQETMHKRRRHNIHRTVRAKTTYEDSSSCESDLESIHSDDDRPSSSSSDNEEEKGITSSSLEGLQVAREYDERENGKGKGVREKNRGLCCNIFPCGVKWKATFNKDYYLRLVVANLCASASLLEDEMEMKGQVVWESEDPAKSVYKALKPW